MKRRIPLVTTIVLAALLGIFAEGTWAQETSDIKSPRLQALADEVGTGNPKALDDFWNEMETSSTPFVEAIAGDDKHVLLTVLWRGDLETENVLLIGGLARGYPANTHFQQLLDTDVWFITYWTGTDLRASYKLSPNDSLEIVPMNDAKAVAAQRKNYRKDPLNPNTFGGSSLIELPDAPDQSWILENPAAPKGETQTERNFKSTMLGNERRVSVYLPPKYDPTAAPYPMLLVFDQSTYLSVIPTPRILDNLIHADKIPPVICVLERFKLNYSHMRQTS